MDDEKIFEIKFHGTTRFFGTDPDDAESSFLFQAETVSEDFIIDEVKEYIEKSEKVQKEA